MRNSSGNRNKGGDAFREWLSDRLRYFILLAALLVAIAAISMFSRLLDSNMNRNNRNMNQSGSASAVKTEKETEEAIVILSEGGETAQSVQQEQSKDAADESAGEVTQETAAQESAPETVAEETKAEDAAEETVTEAQTQQAVEETTEEQTEEATEEVTEEAAEKVTEKQTEEVTEKQTEEVTGKAEEEVTEKVTEKAEEEVTEKVTEKAEEEVTEKVTEKAEEEVTEKVTEKAEEKVTEKTTEKTSERHSGLMTTSSTERTVHTSSDSKKPVTAATLAGVGAEEEETETESRVTTGNIIVTNTGSSARVTVLVTGGSSTSGNRASVTNIDTGNTIGTYRRVANTGSVFPTINTGSTANTGVTDNSDGLIQPADGSVTVDSSTVDVAAQQEVVPVAPPAPEPEYRTVVSACNIRSYPDYGDNVIGGLYGGETVLFYGLEEGWDKIEYNGIVGYIGPKFLR
ncbi:MAG: SH3 domain-containing protein [Lachnospiraceae bacterium]|nr:SH3 domain-containing protein [Lachnospiraceae bacterium]